MVNKKLLGKVSSKDFDILRIKDSDFPRPFKEEYRELLTGDWIKIKDLISEIDKRMKDLQEKVSIVDAHLSTHQSCPICTLGKYECECILQFNSRWDELYLLKKQILGSEKEKIINDQIADEQFCPSSEKSRILKLLFCQIPEV